MAVLELRAQQNEAGRRLPGVAHGGRAALRCRAQSVVPRRGQLQKQQRLKLPQAVSPTNDSKQLTDLSTTISLDNIRQSLIRQEDSIIFSLIERAQFLVNEPVYQKGAIPVPVYNPHSGERYTFLEFFLRENEQLWGKMRRYTSPDEMAFFPEALPSLILPPLKYPKVLFDNRDISINDEIFKLYVDTIIPGFCAKGNDNNFGSTAMYDCMCLQALSKRIHYGKFVAEAKFSNDRETYTPLIEAQDADGLMALLTFPEVEQRVIDRVTKKAATIGQDLEGAEAGENISYKVQPEKVGELYRDWIMPLTKKVQVKYLLQRLENEKEWESEKEESLSSGDNGDPPVGLWNTPLNSDPMEEFCQEQPDADECRVYED